ncbi:hypothetical protein [Mycobacterium sp. SM3041]|uniref:hypothetical protein n=1 Tax=Mycobacterium sp. SM3041 TaxID=3114291 RepID=UPI003204EB89
MSCDPVANLLDELDEALNELDYDVLTENDVLLMLSATLYVRDHQPRKPLQGRPHLTLISGGQASR